MENIVFTQLSISELRKIFRQEIEDTLLNYNKNGNSNPDRWLSLDELREYLPGKPTRATIYRWVKQGKIPTKKFGNRLGFLKSEIDQFLKEKHRIVNKKIQVEDYLKGKK